MTTTTMAQRSYQCDYDRAVELGNAPAGYGIVADYYGAVDRYGSVVLVIVFDDGRKLSPFFDQYPSDEDMRDIENDAHEWADNMSGATEWYAGTWHVV